MQGSGVGSEAAAGAASSSEAAADMGLICFETGRLIDALLVAWGAQTGNVAVMGGGCRVK